MGIGKRLKFDENSLDSSYHTTKIIQQMSTSDTIIKATWISLNADSIIP